MLRRADSLRVPAYRRHKPSGQAVVTLSGRDHYLGMWNTRASRAEYDRLTGEWLAGGRFMPDAQDDAGPTVAELLAAYWRFAKGYYRKDGRPTSELDEYRQSKGSLLLLAGGIGTQAACLGPRAAPDAAWLREPPRHEPAAQTEDAAARAVRHKHLPPRDPSRGGVGQP
ncbi:MAG: hypothetical protein NTW96_03795 [Planctomycetia bacterium]|nr:hypothetical protein [Planctomycetia bacterium]